MFAISIIGSISAIWPNKWTGIIALVFSVTADSISSGSILNVFASISTNTGFAPVRVIQPTVAKNVNGVVITSSPEPISRLIKLFRMASVPLEAPTANLQSLIAAIFSSNSATFGPPMHRCDSRTSETVANISSFMVAYCAFRSSKGTSISILLITIKIVIYFS